LTANSYYEILCKQKKFPGFIIENAGNIRLIGMTLFNTLLRTEMPPSFSFEAYLEKWIPEKQNSPRFTLF